MAEPWSLSVSILVSLGCAIVILLLGIRLSGAADALADRTGLGEAFVGAVFLGATTSLPGITASVTAAWDGFASLAVSNALGGIAAQTAFLAVADIAYRQVNLEHAAASLPNIMSASLLIALLALLLLAMTGPEITFWHIHPVTPVLFASYAAGLHLIRHTQTEPMWRPRRTGATRTDEPDPDLASHASLSRLVAVFAVTALVVALAGWLLTQAAESIAVRTGLNESVVGGLMVGVVTSLPELVTTVAAVNRGALTLAVGGIIGGNAFDTLFAGMADVAYRGGSVYHAASEREQALVVVTILMTTVMVMGLIYRQRRGLGNIGFESVLMLCLYGLGVLMLAAMG